PLSMATKKGAAGPSILRSNFRWTAVSAPAGNGQANAAARSGAANRVSRMRSTIIMPGSLLHFTNVSGVPGFPLRSDKEHAAAKRKQKLQRRDRDKRALLTPERWPAAWNRS